MPTITAATGPGTGRIAGRIYWFALTLPAHNDPLRSAIDTTLLYALECAMHVRSSSLGGHQSQLNVLLPVAHDAQQEVERGLLTGHHCFHSCMGRPPIGRAPDASTSFQSQRHLFPSTRTNFATFSGPYILLGVERTAYRRLRAPNREPLLFAPQAVASTVDPHAELLHSGTVVP